MRLLSAPFEPAALAPPRGPARAYGQVAGVAALLATAGVALEWAGVAPLGHALASGAVHGGLLALGWLLATDAAPGWTGPVVRLGATVLLASVTARVHPLGALAFLLVPGLLLLEGWRRPRLRAIGLRGARPVHAAVGLAVGAFLGAHLLVTASRTFGYRLQAGGLAPLSLGARVRRGRQRAQRGVGVPGRGVLVALAALVVLAGRAADDGACRSCATCSIPPCRTRRRRAPGPCSTWAWSA